MDGELWLASQKHVTLLINNMERSSVDRWSDENVFVILSAKILRMIVWRYAYVVREQQFVAAVVKGRKSVYWKLRKTPKTCFIYKASQKANNNIY